MNINKLKNIKEKAVRRGECNRKRSPLKKKGRKKENREN